MEWAKQASGGRVVQGDEIASATTSSESVPGVAGMDWGENWKRGGQRGKRRIDPDDVGPCSPWESFVFIFVKCETIVRFWVAEWNDPAYTFKGFLEKDYEGEQQWK